jgi:uncharacterized protein with GYD domain
MPGERAAWEHVRGHCTANPRLAAQPLIGCRPRRRRAFRELRRSQPFVTGRRGRAAGIKCLGDNYLARRAFKATARKLGVKVTGQFWTLGAFDGVLVCEAPDEETLTAGLLHLGALGNIRTQTVRAFDAAEMQKILGLLPR